MSSVDLDRSWHGIHFLLSGTRDGGNGPEHFLLGGQRLPNAGDAEVFHYRTAEVREIERVLQACTPGVFLERFNGDLMRKLDIYPKCGWEHRDFDYLLEYYNDLRSFVSQHAAAGNELLVIIS